VYHKEHNLQLGRKKGKKKERNPFKNSKSSRKSSSSSWLCMDKKNLPLMLCTHKRIQEIFAPRNSIPGLRTDGRMDEPTNDPKSKIVLQKDDACAAFKLRL
jgi:hypothetical protein